MLRFFFAMAIGIYFFTKMDILIWQRIFETHELWDLGIGTYHNGWTYALFGFMAMGAMFFYPNLRRVVMFPLSLMLVAFSGTEDILYYWLDGRAVPDVLPWLDTNPLVFKPVTRANLFASAGLWLALVVALEVLGSRLDRRKGGPSGGREENPSGGRKERTAFLRFPIYPRNLF